MLGITISQKSQKATTASNAKFCSWYQEVLGQEALCLDRMGHHKLKKIYIYKEKKKVFFTIYRRKSALDHNSLFWPYNHLLNLTENVVAQR